MPNKQYIVTKQGLDNLKAELLDRLTVQRIRIADKIEEATKQGDLSENAMYTAALEEQQMNEAKILELTEAVQNAVVVRSNKNNDKIELGERFTLEDLSNKKKYEYTLVGEEEADPIELKLSINSPMGNALLGKHVGDTVEVVLPGGLKKYKILENHH